jgi:dTDP-4-amino-4,6-dideoxygalactose transaminase
MQVPFLDLRAQHTPLMTELVDAFRQVTEASAFAGGPFVARFESEFAAFCRTRHALGVGSGTDALWLSLLALGVGPGDEVITVCNSLMATAEVISLCGARPVFVDIVRRPMVSSASGRAPSLWHSVARGSFCLCPCIPNCAQNKSGLSWIV